MRRRNFPLQDFLFPSQGHEESRAQATWFTTNLNSARGFRSLPTNQLTLANCSLPPPPRLPLQGRFKIMVKEDAEGRVYLSQIGEISGKDDRRLLSEFDLLEAVDGVAVEGHSLAQAPTHSLFSAVPS